MKRAIATHRANRNVPASSSSTAALPENDRYVKETNLQVTCTSFHIIVCFVIEVLLV